MFVPATGKAKGFRGIFRSDKRVSVSLWSVLVVAVFVCLMEVASLGRASASGDSSYQTTYFTSKDGLSSVRFSDRTDDAALKAAIPTLLAKSVQSVDLTAAPVQDISALSVLTDLRDLNLCGTLVRDLSPLSKLTALRSLNLQFVRAADFRPISALTELRTLNLGGTEARDLSALSGLTNLQHLVTSVTKVKDLGALAGLRQLMSLDLGGTSVSSIRPLSGLTNLRSLTLNGTLVKDLRPLAAMEHLRRLDLGSTPVDNVQPLAGLRSLVFLDLEATQVRNVAPLAKLPNLQSLALGGSLVRDMTPIAAMAFAKTPAAQSDLVFTNPVAYWNDQVNRAIQTTNTDPFNASRALAIHSIAVLDTVRSLSGETAYWVRLTPPTDIPMGLAIAGASHAVLVQLFPNRRAALDASLTTALAQEQSPDIRQWAVEFGRSVANAIVALRANDGWNVPTPFPGTATPGSWRPTPQEFQPAQVPHWGKVAPFAMAAPSQFRPAGPPPIGSQAYLEAKAAVLALGSTQSALRTAEQTETAHYWSDGANTYTPAGHWNAIATQAMVARGLTLPQQAELLAVLNIAIADAGIAAADAKYHFAAWRPITAIRSGDDGEAAIPEWTPLLTTPNHPTYLSGHSTFSGAAAAVLTARLGPMSFTSLSANLPGMSRGFTSFNEAAEEAAASRVFGGIHFVFDNTDGLATGRRIAAWALDVFQKRQRVRDPVILVENPKPGATAFISGCVLDNVEPIRGMTVALDGGKAVSIPVSEQGLFTVPASILPDQSPHEITLTATNALGRTGMLTVDVVQGVVVRNRRLANAVN